MHFWADLNFSPIDKQCIPKKSQKTQSFCKSKESRKNGPTVQIFDLAIPKDVLHARIATGKTKQYLVTL